LGGVGFEKTAPFVPRLRTRSGVRPDPIARSGLPSRLSFGMWIGPLLRCTPEWAIAFPGNGLRTYPGDRSPVDGDPISPSQFADVPSLTAVFSVNIQREISSAGLKSPSLARVNPKIQFLACEIQLLLFTSLTSLGKRSRRTSSILCF
jgi:hypothetical protein